MSIDIRPFTETTGDAPSPAPASDARASEFMDSLRARIETQDEAQKKTWIKAEKPEPKRKPMTPGNPSWMNVAKVQKDTPKPGATLRSRPFGSPKKHTRK